MAALREVELLEAALTRFHEATGICVTQHPLARVPGPQADAQLQFTDGNHKWTYLAEVKAQVDRVATLYAVQNQIQRFPGEGILIAPYLAPEVAKKCKEIGLPFLDAAGNAFLRQEGLFVLVAGQKPDKALFRPEKPMRAFDRTGLRVVFALLVEPTLLQAPYRDIARAAGVALGTVGWILTDLREHGYLVEDRKGIRRWIDRERVIQTWNTNFPFRLRERLRARRYATKESDWWKVAEPEAFGGYWGGEVAAAKLTGELIPKTVTLYLPEERNAFLAKYRLRADPQGQVEVLDTFWEQTHHEELPAGTAPPLLVYADLNHIGDPRTLEQAKVIHDRYLA